ncbi:hypothetical protein PR202_ga06886 [Eleusine coracana subsp. coracana]|uniref:Uncharacterized protein n=1 Tax=Eleusine coracana subsp. coracana TaxID=191504 RepID=A0AAV5BYC9_ELECO|nr:hypothetical protein PR202_ga06886 [Eleusine coracana subsp. coracana]
MAWPVHGGSVGDKIGSGDRDYFDECVSGKQCRHVRGNEILCSSAEGSAPVDLPINSHRPFVVSFSHTYWANERRAVAQFGPPANTSPAAPAARARRGVLWSMEGNDVSSGGKKLREQYDVEGMFRQWQPLVAASQSATATNMNLRRRWRRGSKAIITLNKHGCSNCC